MQIFVDLVQLAQKDNFSVVLEIHFVNFLKIFLELLHTVQLADTQPCRYTPMPQFTVYQKLTQPQVRPTAETFAKNGCQK